MRWCNIQTSDYDLRVMMYPIICTYHGPLPGYAKWRFAHAPGMLGTFSPLPISKETAIVSEPGMHHVPWCMSGSLTRGGGENVPGIPGACTTRHFMYLARGLRLHDSNKYKNPAFLGSISHEATDRMWKYNYFRLTTTVKNITTMGKVDTPYYD